MHAIILVFAAVLLALWPARIGAQCNQCEGDFNNDRHVTVDELVKAVNNALNGCPAPPPRYADNDDGTITDTSTGLMWEKKSNDGSIHDKDSKYTWSTTGTAEDGTVFTTFLVTLNQTKFARHDDWRLPSVIELRSLADNYALWAPAIDPVFNTNIACDTPCSVTACSCTAEGNYWSSTTHADPGLANFAWYVDFNYGIVNAQDKALPVPGFHARAVRGGS